MTSRNFQADLNGSIVNVFYLVLASIRSKLSAFDKVQWLHFTRAVDKFVSIRCDVSSGFSVPKITKIG